MRQRTALPCALLLASCALAPGGTVAPVPGNPPPPEAAPGPRVPEPVALPEAPKVAAVAESLPADAHARDSVLDAAMLDRIAEARAPETGEPAFDIDVANFSDHDRVKYWLDFFTGPARERMGIWLQRMPRYEPDMRARLALRGLPGDLAYLPLIESGYSPTAVSRSRAVGMWQFMRATGKYYGLTVDGWVDERRDVPRATDAAVRYLADLTARFGSPYLAAAAYNGGPGRIQRGLARLDPGDEDEEADLEPALDPDSAGTAPQAGDVAFFQLADTRFIRQETKDYVPKLIAAAMIAKQPERFGFPALVPLESVWRLDSVVVTDAVGLDVVGRLAGMTLQEVWDLNPVYLRPMTPPKRRAVIRVPAGRGTELQDAVDMLPAGERLTGFPHHAKSGETIASLARRYSVSAEAVRELNPEYRKRAPRRGDVVRIPGQARLAGWVSESRRTGVSAAGASTHRVKAGETLGGIARRYRVSVAQLRTWNHLRSDALIRAGQTLRLEPGAAASRSAVSRKAAARVHVVRAGETLSSLARRYGVTVEGLRAVNDLPAGRPLAIGRRLTIPS